jgi:hypothetical protein
MIDQYFSKFFGGPAPFAIFAMGEFAPNEVRMFSKRVQAFSPFSRSSYPHGNLAQSLPACVRRRWLLEQKSSPLVQIFQRT